MNTFSISQRVGEIAAIMPKASEVSENLTLIFAAAAIELLPK